MNPRAEASERPSTGAARPFLRHVRVRNYKSIGKCAVDLGPLSLLVGRNGAGKSNFLDALRFIVDGLQSSLDHAIKARGGIDEVRRRSTGHPRNFSIRVDFDLPNLQDGSYAFEVAARGKGGYVVRRESLVIRDGRNDVVAQYHVAESTVNNGSAATMPPAAPDRLYLVTAAGLPQFRPIYDALSSMGFYNLNPQAMKELQSPDAGELLHRDGSNIASVVARLAGDRPEVEDRINDYLVTIVPGITEVHRAQLGPRETLQFRQEIVGSQHPWKFYAASMSDGTLRALGAIVAVMQLSGRIEPVRLVGIEEPEAALHPAASGALMDALREAVGHTQILITTHSPDLLEQIDVDHDALLVVRAEQGETRIAPADPAAREAVRSHLYSAADLLRMDQLAPDENHLRKQGQMTLFDTDEGEDEA